MLCSNMLDRPSTPTPLADAAPEDLSSEVLAKEDHFAWAQGLLIRQVMRLEALSESALRMALAIERQATGSSAEASAKEEIAGLAAEASAKAGAEAPAAPPPSLDAAAMAFSRVARGMHMTALLQSRLIGELEQGRRREEGRAEVEGQARMEIEREAYRRDPALGRKRRVEDIVERVAMARLGDDDRALDRLMTQACERLDDDDIYGDVATRPVGELVALICRDLGLEPDWPSLAQEAWAREEIESGVEGSPFVSLRSAGGPLPRERRRSLDGADLDPRGLTAAEALHDDAVDVDQRLDLPIALHDVGGVLIHPDAERDDVGAQRFGQLVVGAGAVSGDGGP
jgi:hypothetical protein